MAKKRITPNLDAVAATMEPRIRAAFLAAVENIVDGATIAQVEAAIAAANVEAVIAALDLEGAAFDGVVEEARAAFIRAGRETADAFPTVRQNGYQVNIYFSGSNTSAEALLAAHSSAMVVEITEGTREGVRQLLLQGQQLNRHPRQTALDIIGRVGDGGRRSGGIVGLTGQQTGYVTNMRSALSGIGPGGDPTGRFWITRDGKLGSSLTARDKRFDRTILRALRDGRPVAAGDITKMTGRYADRLVRLRGEAIARTETGWAMANGQREAMSQQIEAGKVDQNVTQRVWDSSGHDGRTRQSHLTMEGQRRAWGEPFTTPTGYSMMHPLDSSLGAPASETIQCRCIERYEVDL